MGTFSGVLDGSLLSSIPKEHEAHGLLQKYGAKVYAYADLPTQAKAAVDSYLRDESGWGPQVEQMRFALALWPTAPVGGAVVRMGRRFEPDGDQWQRGFNHYHEWYMKNVPVEQHGREDPWPSLLDVSPDGEFFLDGWHRFHRYVELGLPRVPVLWRV